MEHGVSINGKMLLLDDEGFSYCGKKIMWTELSRVTRDKKTPRLTFVYKESLFSLPGGSHADIEKAYELYNNATMYSGEEGEYLKRFIGDNSSYYAKRTWNWAAFILTFFWAAYRRYNKLAFGCFGVFAVLEILSRGLGLYAVSGILGILFLLLKLYIGFEGNSLYIANAKKLLSQTSDKEECIRKHGGVGGAPVLIMFGCYLALIVAVVLIGYAVN